VIDLRKLLDSSSVGDPAKDDYALPIVTLRSFGFGGLVSEYAVLVHAKHLRSEMINGQGGAGLRTSVGDNTRQVAFETSFNRTVKRRDRWMGITWSFTDQAVVVNTVSTRSSNPVKERLHSLDLDIGIITSADEACNRFPDFAWGHSRVGQGNGRKLGRKVDNRPGCHIISAGLIWLIRSDSFKGTVFGEGLIKGLGLGHKDISSMAEAIFGEVDYRRREESTHISRVRPTHSCGIMLLASSSVRPSY
jgi:hypothetical protein